MEHALDVLPVTDVALGSLTEGGFDEVWWILLGGDEKAFGDERGDGADMLLVEMVDVGAAHGLRFVGDGAGAEFEVAAAGTSHGATGGGVVHEVDGLLPSPASEVEGEERAELHAGGEALFERLAASGQRLEGGGGIGDGPDLVGGEETGIALLILDEAGDPEEGQQGAGLAHGREDRRVEGVGDGRGLADAGKALEGGRVVHRWISSGSRSSSSGWSAQSSNLARRWRKRSSTAPVGPLRCFATMTWATPWG